MTNDNRDDTTPAHADTLPAQWEPYPIATLDMPPTREISAAQQIAALHQTIATLSQQRRLDLEAMEAAQALLLPVNCGMLRSSCFDLLEARTGWLARTSQSIACGGPLEGE